MVRSLFVKRRNTYDGKISRGGQCIWEAGCWLKMGEGGGRRGEICLGCGRSTSYRDVGGRIKMITRRRDVAEKQVWDAGGEGKNVWDVGMPIIKTMGGGRQVKKSKRSKIVVGGGRREGGQKWHWEAGCRTKMKREAGCCTPVSPLNG